MGLCCFSQLSLKVDSLPPLPFLPFPSLPCPAPPLSSLPFFPFSIIFLWVHIKRRRCLTNLVVQEIYY